MTPKPDKPKTDQASKDIARHAARMKARRDNPGPSPLRGLGMFGAVGWAIVVPTVGGAFLGHWLDRVAPQGFSWTIALILGGVVLGAILAARWINTDGGDK